MWVCEWSMPNPGCFTSGRDTVPFVWKAGWNTGPVWTGAENLAEFDPLTVQAIDSRSFSLPHGYRPNLATPKLQYTSKQEHTTIVVIQKKSRRLMMMDVLMSETCWV